MDIGKDRDGNEITVTARKIEVVGGYRRQIRYYKEQTTESTSYPSVVEWYTPLMPVRSRSSQVIKVRIAWERHLRDSITAPAAGAATTTATESTPETAVQTSYQPSKFQETNMTKPLPGDTDEPEPGAPKRHFEEVDDNRKDEGSDDSRGRKLDGRR
jgi:hypothetical protein